MDPISHGVMGLALYSLVHTPTLSSAACLGAVIGSVSPDIDIITRIKGDYVYLNHHRVESHSLPGLAILSGLASIFLSLIYSNFSFYQVFLWTFLGGLSHTLLDCFNSYGVALLYPFNRKKYSINLLMIYDPIFLLLSFYSILYKPRSILIYTMMLGITILYLSYRGLDKNRLRGRLTATYKNYVKSINILPSAMNLFKWDYIIDTDSYYIVGEINSLTNTMNIIKELKKVVSPMIEKSLKDELGIYFKNFTPFFHVDLFEEKEKLIVRMTDLRYRIKNEFKHHASFYYNEEKCLIRSVFHPFSQKNDIEIHCEKSVDNH